MGTSAGKMKIIAFLWVNPIWDAAGGVERVTGLLMKGLTARKYRCINIVCKDNCSIYYERTISEQTKIEDIDTYLIENKVDAIINQEGIFSDRFSLMKKDLKWKGKYIVVFHNDPSMYCYLFSKERIKTEIYNPANKLTNRVGWLARLLLYKIWYPRVIGKIRSAYLNNYNNCDHLVFLSSHFFSNYKQITKIEDMTKCVAIPNPLSFLEIADDSVLRQKKKEILIVSRLYEPEKRISLCLNVWKNLMKKGYSDWMLRIVGYGQDEDNYKLFVKKENLKNVIFEGKQESYKFYKTASIFLMTSAFEGWGLTLTESLQMGVVPVTMDSYKSIHDIITDNYNGKIVPNNNINELQNQIEGLMNDKELLLNMACNALKSADKFKLDNVLDKWERIINQKI